MLEKNISILILAAGASTRMGQPKQLLPWNETTLLKHAIQQARNAKAKDVFVVLGAHFEKIYPTIQDEAIQVLRNESWETGMSSSIALGTQKVMESTGDALLIMLADQPFIGTNELNAMIDLVEGTAQSLVATAYEKGYGVPAIFGKKYFEQLSQLSGPKGAKSLIAHHTHLITPFQPPQVATVDIDTPSTYQELINQTHV